MKKVLYKIWQLSESGNSYTYSNYEHEASFLAFGVDFMETNEGIGQFTTAILEKPDGTVFMARADEIKFVKEEVSANLQDAISKVYEAGEVLYNIGVNQCEDEVHAAHSLITDAHSLLLGISKKQL